MESFRALHTRRVATPLAYDGRRTHRVPGVMPPPDYLFTQQERRVRVQLLVAGGKGAAVRTENCHGTVSVWRPETIYHIPIYIPVS